MQLSFYQSNCLRLIMHFIYVELTILGISILGIAVANNQQGIADKMSEMLYVMIIEKEKKCIHEIKKLLMETV